MNAYPVNSLGSKTTLGEAGAAAAGSGLGAGASEGVLTAAAVSGTTVSSFTRVGAGVLADEEFFAIATI